MCEGDGNAGVGDEGGVVVVSAGNECMGGTRGSDVMSSAYDVIEVSVVCGIRGVGGMCKMCMCLARGGRCGGSECERIGFVLYHSCRNRGSVGHVSVL